MSGYANLSSGVAPFWVSTGDGDFTPTQKCIGFYVEVGGDVSFVSNGNTITRNFQPSQIVSLKLSLLLLLALRPLVSVRL